MLPYKDWHLHHTFYLHWEQYILAAVVLTYIRTYVNVQSQLGNVRTYVCAVLCCFMDTFACSHCHIHVSCFGCYSEGPNQFRGSYCRSLQDVGIGANSLVPVQRNSVHPACPSPQNGECMPEVQPILLLYSITVLHACDPVVFLIDCGSWPSVLWKNSLCNSGCRGT